MDTILQQFYEGKLIPVLHPRPATQEYQDISQQHSQHYDAFRSTLKDIDPALPKQFDALQDEMLELNYIETKEEFLNGFRLGARMMLEILDGPEV